jgi:hypothetical protein
VEKTDAASTANAKANLWIPLKPSPRIAVVAGSLTCSLPRRDPINGAFYNNLYRVSRLMAANSATFRAASIEN